MLKKLLVPLLIVFLFSVVSAQEETLATDYQELFEESGLKLKKFLDEKIPGKVLALIHFKTGDEHRDALLSDIYSHYLKGGKFTLIDRKSLPETLKEIELELQGLTEPKHVEKFGEMLNADFLHSGGMSTMQDKVYVTMRVVDISNGDLIYSDAFNFKNEEFLSVKDFESFLAEQKYPSSALFRSALFPGWGQFYNDKPVKGGIFLGLHIALAATTITFAALPWEDKSGSNDPKEMQKALDRGKFNKYFFVGSVSALGVNLISSMIDAYIDANRKKKQ
jgi:TolB-like protein